MDDIERYSLIGDSIVKDCNGEYVRYSDHMCKIFSLKGESKRLINILKLFTTYKLEFYKWALMPKIKITLARAIIDHIRKYRK